MQINFFGINNEEIEEKITEIIENDFVGSEFSVMTEESREEEIENYISESIWAFNPWFLADMTGLPQEVFECLSEKCEGSNDVILELVEKTCGLDEFTECAVGIDGYGHFLSQYDGEEYEIKINRTTYYIYRNN